MTKFMEEYIDNCVLSFHNVSNYMRDLMFFDTIKEHIRERLVMEELDVDTDDKVLDLLTEQRLIDYYNDRNDLAISMLRSINVVGKIQ